MPEENPRKSAEGQVRLSPPINELGDRILVPGEPEALEKLYQLRKTRGSAQARCRVRAHLEADLPALVARCSPAELSGLTNLIVSLCEVTAQDFAGWVIATAKKSVEVLPATSSVPDPEQDPGGAGGLLRTFADQGLPTDPLVIDSETDGTA